MYNTYSLEERLKMVGEQVYFYGPTGIESGTVVQFDRCHSVGAIMCAKDKSDLDKFEQQLIFEIETANISKGIFRIKRNSKYCFWNKDSMLKRLLQRRKFEDTFVVPPNKSSYVNLLESLEEE